MSVNTASSKRRTALLGGVVVLGVLLSACAAVTTPNTSAIVPNGNPQQGQRLVRTYGCATCHMIPGVQDADGRVGPPLHDWSRRGYIAGRVPNTPENLIQWLQNPQSIDPQNTMPNMGVTETDARDLAAYLFSIGSTTRYDGVTTR